MSDSDSDVEAVSRNRKRLQKENKELLFRDESQSPQRPAPPKRKQLPRFLGDDLDEDSGVGNPFGSTADDLFSDLDDVPNAVPARFDASDNTSNNNASNLTNLDGLDADNVGGLDVDDVGVVKKRRVVAKMDDNRLMGPNGFPKLRSEVAAFRVRGKGHELKDLKRLMSLYQLWAHQMYPKTNLRDTLQTIEKLCHKRSLHRALKQYRDEAKEQRSKLAAEELDAQVDGLGAAAEAEAEMEMDLEAEAAMREEEEQSAAPVVARKELELAPAPEEEDAFANFEDEFEVDEEAERMMLEMEFP